MKTPTEKCLKTCSYVLTSDGNWYLFEKSFRDIWVQTDKQTDILVFHITGFIFIFICFMFSMWLSRLGCQRQILIVRFGVRILLEIRKVFRLDNSILNKIEVPLKWERNLHWKKYKTNMNKVLFKLSLLLLFVLI